jgi:hypothetical protein
MDRNRATSSHDSPDGASHQLRFTSWTSAALIEQCPRPPGRLSVLQPFFAGRGHIHRSGARRSQLPSPSGSRGSVVTSLHSGTVRFIRPLRTDVRIPADLTRALSGLGGDALPQRRDVPVALLASPGVNGRSSRRPFLAPSVRNNWDSSSAQPPTWVRGCRMALESQCWGPSHSCG